MLFGDTLFYQDFALSGHFLPPEEDIFVEIAIDAGRNSPDFDLPGGDLQIAVFV